MTPTDSPWWGNSPAWNKNWNAGWDWSKADPTGPLISGVLALLKSRFLGKPLTIPLGGHDFVLTPVDLDVDLGRVALATGQLDDVTLHARDVSWRGLSTPTATATFRNACLRPGKSAQVVAGPIDLTFTLSATDLDTLVATHRPGLLVEITEDDRILLRSRARPGWAHLEVDLDADGPRIRISPRHLARGNRGTAVVARIPAFSFRLPVPAGKLHVVSMTTNAGGLEVEARLDQAQVTLGSWLDLPTK